MTAVIILAAGQGTRMKSQRHKVTHEIGNRALLLHILDNLCPFEVRRKLVVLGALRDQVEAILPADVEIVQQDEQRGTAHAVGCASDVLSDYDGPVLILYGDCPLIQSKTLRQMLKILKQRKPLSVVLGFQANNPEGYGRIIADEDNRITKMVEQKDANAEERDVRLCNSGILAIQSRALFHFLPRIGNKNASGEYYLPDLINLAHQDGEESLVHITDEDEVMGINDRQELAQAEKIWQNRSRSKFMKEGVTLIDPDTVYFSTDTTIGRDVVIEPAVILGPGVSIGDGSTIHAGSYLKDVRVGKGCAVGPYARLRDQVVMEDGSEIGNFVEAKKSTFGIKAKAKHLSYIGDSELGSHVNIGAGTITCNYDGYMKYKSLIGDGAFIGSNSSLVAPIRIGSGAIVGAGSVITRDVPADALSIARGKQVDKEDKARQLREALQERKTEQKAR